MDGTASTAMVGRRAELGILRDAYQRCVRGETGVVVVTGEAGIGKSRLVEEFVRSLPDEAVVAQGQCVDLRDLGAPLLPIRAVMTELAARFGADSVIAAAADASIHAVLPHSGGERQLPHEAAGNPLLETFLRVLGELSARRPLVIVVEDVHWGDNATLALLGYAARMLRSARVLLVFTVRTGELPRGHRLRADLAELARVRTVDQVDLTRLSRDEIAELIQTHGSGASADALHQRSGGVPYFAEELLRAAGSDLPTTLGDLLRARYEGASSAAQELLRVIAVGGARVTDPPLDAVFDRGSDVLETAAREAIAAGLLVADDTGYAFRHTLVREVLLDDLLPGERSRLHATWAAALAASGRPGVAAEVSTHWHAAGRTAEAFAAAVIAMDATSEALAPVATGVMAQRCVELWTAVDDAAGVAGAGLAEVVRRGMTAYRLGGRSDLAVALADSGLARMVDADPIDRARILSVKASDMGQIAALDSGAVIEEGLALIGDRTDPPARAVRAELLLNEAARLMLEGATDDAVVTALAAMEEGLAAGEPGRATASMAANIAATSMTDRIDAWSPDEATALFDRAAELAVGSWHARSRLAINRSDALCRVGRFTEALAIAEPALAEARRRGEHRWVGVVLSANASEALIGLGEWDRARAVIEDAMRFETTTWFRAYLEQGLISLMVWSDRLDEAEAYLRRVGRHHGEIGLTQRQVQMAHAISQADLLLARGDTTAALGLAVTELGEDVPDFLGGMFRLIHAAARAWRAEAAAGRRSDAAAARLRGLLDALARSPIAAPWTALIEAELAGTPDERAEGFGAAAELIRTGLVPRHMLAYALVERAGALAERGRFADADAARAEGVAEAERIGARYIVRLAREQSTDRTAEALTRREQQVLDLVAEGLTNREIGERLYISDKTVSVHVSAVLRKLGVTSRAAAAAVAASAPRG